MTVGIILLGMKILKVLQVDLFFNEGELAHATSADGLVGEGAFFALARSLRASLPARRILPTTPSLSVPRDDGPRLAHS